MSDELVLHIAYLGPEASFSHQAALELFPPPKPASQSTKTHRNSQVTIAHHPLPSFSTIFSSLQHSSSSLGSQNENQQYDYAVLPIENSTNGSVVQVLDLIAQCGLHGSDDAYPDLEVCAEYYLPVHHCLFVRTSSLATTAKEDQDQKRKFPFISILYTHPQVWGQCGQFLTAHFPPDVVERIDVGSTSAAAALVAREGKVEGRPIDAAISSRLAGEKHNLVCLAENIEDSPGDNTTRFLVLRNRRRKYRHALYHHDLVSRVQPVAKSTTSQTPSLVASSQRPISQQTLSSNPRYKSLITFTIPHTKPGSLADALAVFKTYGFNLTSIDTRPSRRRNWQYVFFVECEEAATTSATGGTSEEKNTGTANTSTSMGTNTLSRELDEKDDLGENLRNILNDLAKYTESLRYLGRFVDQL